jgi:hypothetical protein
MRSFELQLRVAKLLGGRQAAILASFRPLGCARLEVAASLTLVTFASFAPGRINRGRPQTGAPACKTLMIARVFAIPFGGRPSTGILILNCRGEKLVILARANQRTGVLYFVVL